MSFTPEQAKQFFIAKVIEEASLTGVSLSGAERAMLQFSEEHVRTPKAILEQFEKETTDEEFEQKVVSLLRSALGRDTAGAASYREAMEALKREDHYIGVMVDEAVASDFRVRSRFDQAVLLALAFAMLVLLLLMIWAVVTHV